MSRETTVSVRVLLALLLLVVALRGAIPLWSNDVFWHVALGNVFVDTGTLPSEDPLTYTAEGRPWVHHEWLSQVLLAFADRAVGLGGLRYVRAGLMVALFALLWRLFRRAGAGPWPALGALGASWIFVNPNVSLRPHVFSWILAVIVFGWLSRRGLSPPGRSGAAWPWWHDVVLGALVVLWANLHASVVIVPLLLAVHGVGALAERLWIGESQVPLGRWALSLGAVAVATLLQPAGFGLLGYVLVTPETNVASGEWQPLLSRGTWLGRPWLVVAWAAVAAAVGVAVWHDLVRRRAAPALRVFPGAAVAISVLYLSAAHRRMAFFLFLALLWILRAIAAWWATPSAKPWRTRINEVHPRLGSALVAVSALLLLTGVVWNAPDALDPRPVRESKFPEAATTVLGAVDLDGRLFATPNWGGFLSYHLYPRYRTFMDGRWIMAGPATLRDAGTIYTHRADAALLDRHGITGYLQAWDDYLRFAPLPAAEWTLAWQDPVAVFLLRRTDTFAANLDRWCAFYQQRPALAGHGRWPPSVEAPFQGSDRGPFAPSSVLDLCPGRQPGPAIERTGG